MRVFDQGVHGVGLKKDALIETILTINRWSPNAIKELLSLSSVPTHLVRPPSIHGSRHSHPYMVPGSMQQQLGACMQCGSIVYHRALSCMQALSIIEPKTSGGGQKTCFTLANLKKVILAAPTGLRCFAIYCQVTLWSSTEILRLDFATIAACH